ncbi:conserved serine-threonine rich protein [Talaromyces stipitatus ATCC 10500]|uniref:Conserved serine-threonine rich protein n=1 Tax=Talaromyces stipitatus (strain ATCC 10500 / CBS 375.48 / QM 6759 / NRRL 1006) TaxID=441959 RepID=B8MDR3_TALSN|nr:conserved serine-threonine rich protein [Talaromyces stipitatus ATCC 10500]EED18292.1 conserved serine-threonine rich protein [Talaromyces stipitatus ATCC 10500]
MSTRALTPTSITNFSLVQSRHTARLVTCNAATSAHIITGCSVQVRMFWGRGWKYAWYNNQHNRVNRRDVLHDMAKAYRGKYVLIKRMANRRSGRQEFWKDWDNSPKQSHHERGDNWLYSKRQRNYWNDDMSALVKKIEEDPYNFLFGKSNEYLRLGKGWSSFCRSFLDPEASSEQKSTTSSVQDHSVKSTTADVSAKDSEVGKDSKADTVKARISSDVEGFQYDPVSGRMKRLEQSATQVARDETRDDNRGIDIPVKVFTSSEGARLERTVPEQGSLRPRDDALSAPERKPQANNDNVLYMAGPGQDKSVTSEDRSTAPNENLQQSEITQNREKKILHYEPKEVTEDDVDLLRASDIRAAFFAGETKQEVAEKKKKLREAMEKDYTLTTSEHVDELILQNLRRKKDASLASETVPGIASPTGAVQVHNEDPEVVQEGETRNTTTRENVTILNNSIGKTLEDARRLINDVHLLTDDIQEACERLEASANSPSDTLRILAFDCASSQVVCAEATSSMHTGEPIRHTADVLLRLNNPAKFLPYFAKMKADGYEIVSGGGDVLIFRKTVTNGSVQPAGFDGFTLDGKEIPDTDAPIPEKGDSPPQLSLDKDPSKSRLVHRQEIVFTGGPPNWSPYEPPSSNPVAGTIEPQPTETSTRSPFSRLGRGLRRIVLSGVATAGTFYAIGVVCEYFVTGGQDGLGPEGFTEFEAERRRREY